MELASLIWNSEMHCKSTNGSSIGVRNFHDANPDRNYCPNRDRGLPKRGRGSYTREVELEIGVEHQTLVQLRAELDHQWAIVDRVELPCDHKESLEAFRHTRELRVASEKYNQFRQPRLRKPRSKELRTNVPALKNPP